MITIEPIENAERWNDFVDRSPQAGVFHRFEALRVQSEHAGADLHPYVGFKGEEPVGLFPVFELRKGPVTTAFSPPPSLRVPYLGPALLDASSLKTQTAERRLKRFVEAAVDRVTESIGPRYVHLRASDAWPDPRPFTWREFDARPRHTYVVDLTPGRDELLSSFSSDARKNVTGADDADHEIAVEGADAVREVFRQVRARYESQGEEFGVPTAFAVDLYERLPDGAVLPYAFRQGGEFCGGIVALDDGTRRYRWQGGVRTDGVDAPVNDLLDWRVMADGIDRGAAEYDLVGADEYRISRYKSKFAPDLRTFHAFERGSTLVSALARGYRHLS